MKTKIKDTKDAVEWLIRPEIKKQLDHCIKDKNTRKAIDVITFFGGAIVHAAEFPFDALVALTEAFGNDLLEAFEEDE